MRLDGLADGSSEGPLVDIYLGRLQSGPEILGDHLMTPLMCDWTMSGESLSASQKAVTESTISYTNTVQAFW